MLQLPSVSVGQQNDAKYVALPSALSKYTGKAGLTKSGDDGGHKSKLVDAIAIEAKAAVSGSVRYNQLGQTSPTGGAVATVFIKRTNSQTQS